ncbi:MAG: hypothetical protein K9M11_03060 [Candidatus Pacebacteria bacterium]|nr:hypothetical protein [Candidatus Paceibacterota bacterium]
MSFCLYQQAFIVTSKIPFEIWQPRWAILPNWTLNIMISIQAEPEKTNWRDQLKVGYPVIFRGIKAGSKTGEITTKTVTATRCECKHGHGEIWEISFS